jgi:hypothetical protein
MPGHLDCPDCQVVTASNDRRAAAAIRLCPVHKAESVATLEHARQTNPDIAALHRMIGLA